MTHHPEQFPGTAPVSFVRDLAVHGDRTALITAGGELSYRDLAARVSAAARRLGPRRRLVLLAGANTVDSLVAYLAALAGGHPLLLVPGGSPGTLRSMIGAYDPDVVIRPVDGRWPVEERHAAPAHELHPDLALLLSTSGSTGSPKLVRLSHGNLQSNAESIARYLDIRATDRAATTLPLHYCYGLSVVNSHLLSGAGLVLTDLSVADTCFWDLFRDSRATTFAAVPYTFDLLDRVGFAHMRLPHLRYLTQAGGRLAPDRVARYAALGRRDGWDLFVMYGQTEATARMAYLPPELAESRPEAIGVPVPGGSFRLRPLPGLPGDDSAGDTGELVYTGPNVMLGYAETPADLARGRTTRELRTGDIARRAPDGLYEVVGRHSRFAKILGLRIDPQQVEAVLGRHGVDAFCAGSDDGLAVAVTAGTDPGRVRRLVADECGLPPRAVHVRAYPELPRLATGKPDYRAVRALVPAPGGNTAERGGPAERRPSARREPARPADLCALYAEILDRDDVTEDSSFTGLGGDSLSYVEMSVRLEEALGRLPGDWHTRSIRELTAAAPAPRRAGRRRALETGVALRAVAIVLIAGSHIPLFLVQGGAHILLGVAGYNFARFHLTAAARPERVRRLGRSMAYIAVPSVVWITGAVLFADGYDPENILLLNSVVGTHEGRQEWHYWFVESLLYILVLLAAVLAVPALDRAERRFPFGFPLALTALALVTRYNLPGFDLRAPHLTALVVFWLFALGWAAARAGTAGQRLLLTAVVLATVPGLFPAGDGQALRTAVAMTGLTLLIWVRNLPSLGPLNRVAGLLAHSSLYIYLTHFQVYPLLKEHSALLALIASLAVGVAYATVVTHLTRRLPALLRRRGWPAPPPGGKSRESGEIEGSGQPRPLGPGTGTGRPEASTPVAA
ncbi:MULTISPECIES: AMP-binding protein [Streptomyces]|uniref:AMP-dependent synthetase n=1 Tax=Streptomyces xinghaiensis TaxID=1038928 RepID=A0A3M8F1X3_9ACTN|nr:MULTISPECIES: AMP-binding protein [Streptomyces]OFA55389.1 AMP-dependent synthetase [Streptomyces fradiae]PQM21330.1 AMP-dependent synthetase [Streptomyces xinghaiensis]RKM93697.1 AMP-dependent synthetase [Streptomyces xinghaiensis]RNC71498.1 AMP-dependent synthetase [Streptomyces xinghaiensis]